MKETSTSTDPLLAALDLLASPGDACSRRALFAQLAARAVALLGASAVADAAPRPVHRLHRSAPGTASNGGSAFIVTYLFTIAIIGIGPGLTQLTVSPIDDPENPIYTSTHSVTLTDAMIQQMRGLAALAESLRPAHVCRFNALLKSFGLSDQALHMRDTRSGLIHHSDRCTQYVSIRCTERLAEAGIERSVGSVGDSYDNALAESVNSLYKAEVIRKRGPWRTIDDVEMATLVWIDWFNNRRLLGPIGHIPLVEFEQAYYSLQDSAVM